MERRGLGTVGIRRLLAAALAAAVLGSVLAAVPAGAAERLVSVRTPPGPGPDRFNEVVVRQFGPENGKRVLVLMPGTLGGAGDFTLTAQHLVSQMKGLQVWAIDRRSNALEDTTAFAAAEGGQLSLQQMFNYYLGWIFMGNPPAHFEFLPEDAAPYAREWGMEVALNDARAVVQLARNGGRRKVVLGGHSLGASLTLAYAAWDFNGRPGYRDLAGLVLIDGGLMGSFDAFTLAQAQAQLADLATTNPFLDLLGLGFPEIAGVFAEIGGMYAEKAPQEAATTLQSFPLLPPQFDPPFPVTNRGLLGYAFDRDSSPADLALLHINSGALALSGDPRDWTDGGVTPIARMASTFGQEPTNGVEWYFPRRLTIDTNGADQMVQNDVTRYLGLRLFHTAKVDLPFYSIATDLTRGEVLAGSRNWVARTRTKKSESTLVNADPVMSHIDPLVAAPDTNVFFSSVSRFLRKKVFPKCRGGKRRGKKGASVATRRPCGKSGGRKKSGGKKRR
jgi:pimeloyl-ACP methyl ester carboxylesterase